MAARFASSNEKEICQFLEDKDSDNTKRSTKVAREIYEEYLKEKNLQEPSEKKDLANVLKSFYIEARKRDGFPYSMGSLKTLRFGLKRHFKAVRGFDIVNDEEFCEANKVFTAKCLQLKKEGLANVEHRPPILDCDLKKLYESDVFSTSHPKTLLNKVFFEIMLCFCRRGRQNLRQLKKSDFIVETDATGTKFVSIARHALTKNHKQNDESEEGGIMCATGSPFCPVESFEKFIQHLNPINEFLFQRPKKKVSEEESQVWYDNMVIGERSLGEMMKNISKEAKLSREYTNHSIRTTAVTILDKSGFEARHIMSVSGHRSETSIRSRTNEAIKRKMSETLTAASAPRDVVISETVNLSQEDHIVRDPSVSSTSPTRVCKHYSFNNCNVFFN